MTSSTAGSLAPLARAHHHHVEGAPSPDVLAEPWVRLVPAPSPEMAAVPVDETTIDRKLAPDDALTLGARGRAFWASEPLVRALVAAGTTGFTATPVPHFSPLDVAGHAFYELHVEGRTGPVVDTPLQPLTWDAPPPEDPDTALRRIPLGRPTFDGARGTGHDLCLSPWFGSGRDEWRVLLIRGEALRRVLDAAPDLALSATPVGVRSFPRRLDHGEPCSVRWARGARSDVALTDALSLLASAPEARLSLPATEDDLACAARACGAPLHEAHATVLRIAGGGRVFGAGLTLYTPKGDGAGSIAWARAMLPGTYGPHEGVVPIGEAPQGRIVWCVDAGGRVRGLGRDGLLYGPDAPVATWLFDQLRDLAWLWDNQETCFWAPTYLGS